MAALAISFNRPDFRTGANLDTCDKKYLMDRKSTGFRTRKTWVLFLALPLTCLRNFRQVTHFSIGCIACPICSMEVTILAYFCNQWMKRAVKKLNIIVAYYIV